MDFLDILLDAENVYRTDYYIVNQRLSIQTNYVEDSMIISRDTYYLRTKERDELYEKYFKERTNIDGKRLPATTYIRKYVD